MSLVDSSGYICILCISVCVQVCVCACVLVCVCVCVFYRYIYVHALKVVLCLVKCLLFLPPHDHQLCCSTKRETNSTTFVFLNILARLHRLGWVFDKQQALVIDIVFICGVKVYI